MKDTLQLDELSITASSLNYILSPPKDDSNSIDRRMYESALNTIRRMEGFLSEDNYIFREGHIREDRIVEKLFQDSNKFELQKKCYKSLIINDEVVKFSATLDVYNKQNDCIIEIKNIINYIIPEKVEDLSDWVHRVYCNQYDPQVQIQMLCCEKFKNLLFLVDSRSFKKIMFSKTWKKDDRFVEKNRYMVLDYWKILHQTYDSFIKRDPQTILDLIMHDEDAYQKLLESIMVDEVQLSVDHYLYIYNDNIELINAKKDIDKQKRELDKTLDVKKANIISAMMNTGFEVNEFHKVDGSNKSLKIKIKLTPASQTYDFERIVRDFGLLHTMSEEEKEKYTTSKERSFSLRVSHKKKEFFED